MSEPYSIAVIGLSCCFPEAKNYHEFWHNLLSEKDCITHFDRADLQQAGLPEDLIEHPNYVKAKGLVAKADYFDADFFGFSPNDATLTDPQIRLFLECAHAALEDAGYYGEENERRIGVFASKSQIGSYLNAYMAANPDFVKKMGEYYLYVNNSNDFLSTKVSYKLNLTGPSLTIQTACSSSLVAICEAAQHLLDYRCDMALAGGVALQFPLVSGYLYQEGMVLSPEGRCRAFDIQANGTVPGNGAGVVVLKRYEEAIADGDHIYALIKGFATNNDGGQKIGYSAPSARGQAIVIDEALKMAQCRPEAISYIEAHGTGTPQGDPIEISALKEVFSSVKTNDVCAIGSVKTNIGHCDVASGIAGFIKTVLALHYKQIPATLHFQKLNPNIDLEHMPFFVNTTLLPWHATSQPRTAGVSSFGVGGTNAHVILAEHQEKPRITEQHNDSSVLLILSAKTPSSLQKMIENLAIFLSEAVAPNLADIAYTYQVGKKFYDYRYYLVCDNVEDAIAKLQQALINNNVISLKDKSKKPVGIASLPDLISQEITPSALTALGDLWACGAQIDWKKFNEGKNCKKISLPTYPFLKKQYSFAIDVNTNEKNLQVSKEPFLYEPYWIWQNINLTNLAGSVKHSILFFHNETVICQAIRDYLEQQGHTIISICHGEYYLKATSNTNNCSPPPLGVVPAWMPGSSLQDAKLFIPEVWIPASMPGRRRVGEGAVTATSYYKINLKNPDHYDQLVQDLKENYNISRVINTLPLSFKKINQGLPEYFETVFYLSQAIIKNWPNKELLFAMLSSGLYQVFQKDRIEPFQAALLGLARTIPYEAPYIKVKLVDVDSGSGKNISQLSRELILENHDNVAYRNEQRYYLSYKEISLEDNNRPQALLRENGTYIISGGLGGVGLALAEAFSKLQAINIILLQRSFFPAKKEWQLWLQDHDPNDPIVKKINIITEIERRGSQVLVVQADVANFKRMSEVFCDINKKFLTINGIVHAAGLPDGALLCNQSLKNIRTIVSPKIKGALVFKKLCQGEAVDFILLCSALTGVTGNIGQLAYSVANNFLNSFSLKYQQDKFIAINWDSWADTGMTLTAKQLSKQLNVEHYYQEMSLNAEKNIHLLWKILPSQLSQCIIVNEPLGDRIKKYHSLSEKLLGKKFYKSKYLEDVDANKNITEVIMQLYAVYLGKKDVSLADDFFALGGDSLLAIQLAAAINKKLGVCIHPHDLQEHPSVQGMSHYLSQVLSHQDVKKKLPFPLCQLQEGENKHFLFLIHPVAGSLYIYRDLINHLPNEITVYGIRDHQRDESRQANSIEEIAASYIALIKEVQPSGSFWLGGFSFGGIVAYEMARQLSLGEQSLAHYVIMIDSPHYLQSPKAFKDNADIIAYLINLTMANPISADEIRQLTFLQQINLLLNKKDQVEYTFPAANVAVAQEFLSIFKINSEIMRRYIAKPIMGGSRVLFLRARQRDAINPAHPEQGWQSLLQENISIHNVPGNHITMMFEPNVREIAGIVVDYYKYYINK